MKAYGAACSRKTMLHLSKVPYSGFHQLFLLLQAKRKCLDVVCFVQKVDLRMLNFKKSTQSIKIPKVKKDNVCLSFLLHFSILHGVYILILREWCRTFTFSKSFEKLYYHTRSSSLTKILKIIGYFSPSRTLKCLNSCLSS